MSKLSYKKQATLVAAFIFKQILLGTKSAGELHPFGPCRNHNLWNNLILLAGLQELKYYYRDGLLKI